MARVSPRQTVSPYATGHNLFAHYVVFQFSQMLAFLGASLGTTKTELRHVSMEIT